MSSASLSAMLASARPRLTVSTWSMARPEVKRPPETALQASTDSSSAHVAAGRHLLGAHALVALAYRARARRRTVLASRTNADETLIAPAGAAFFITTVGADERRRQAFGGLEALSGAIGLQRLVAVRASERDAEDGARGCYEAHLAVYREALAAGCGPALIFEDNLAVDCETLTATGGGEPALRRVLAWAAETLGAWDVLHLSLVHAAAALRLVDVDRSQTAQSLPVVQVERTTPDWYGPVLVKQAPGLGTTAYLISERAMKAILEIDARIGYDTTPIDDLLVRTFPMTTFAAYPSLMHRGTAPSLINSEQELFRAVMYEPKVFRFVESALRTTGASSGQLVWAFLASMAAWTLFVVRPVLGLLSGP